MVLATKKKTEGLVYKGRPLRRKDTLVYYGSMAEKYIVMFQILDSKDQNGVSVPARAAHSHSISVGNRTVIPVLSESQWQNAWASWNVTRETGWSG